MKLTFRTVSGESFPLEAEGSTTIGQLKAMLQAARDVPVDSLKLVYK